MNTRSSIILAVIALGLAAFIYFFERHQPTTDDLSDRGDRVLPGFDRERVDRIILGDGEERVELVRREAEADAGVQGGVGDWWLVHPREVAADPEEVDSLLSAVDWLEKRRTVEGEGVAKAAKFGLADSSGSIRVRLRGRDVKLSLGGEAPGQGLYLGVSTNDDEVYVVDSDFVDQITKEAGELRDKRLAEVRTSQVEAVRVTGRFHAIKRDGRWVLETPQAIRADRRRVEDVIRDVEQLRAERFVADDLAEEDFEQYGLASPAREVTLRVEGNDEAITLRFGGECEGHGDEVYAMTVGSGTVACVPNDIVADLDVDPNRLRDLRPTGFEADDLERVTVTREGRELVLLKNDDQWRIGGDDDGEGRATDEDAVDGFIDALREARPVDVTRDLDGVGLAGEPGDNDVVVQLTPESGEPEVLRFSISEGAVHLRRGDEGVALVLAADLAEILSADDLRFRDRQVVNESSSQAIELEVTIDGARQLLRKEGTRWRLAEPLVFDADQVILREMVRDLARLRVERFVAASPAADHGLTRPRIRLRVRFEADSDDDDEVDAGPAGATDRTLLIGAETEGGAFGRLDGDDETVFVVRGALTERFESPLLDRDLFAVEEDRVNGMTLELTGGATVELRRQGTGWQTADGPAPEGEVDSLLARLAVARAAEVVGLGAASAEAGLASPRARLTLRITGEDEDESVERVLLLGVEYGDESRRRVYARRGDVDATFGLPLRAVRPILEWGGTADDSDINLAPDAGASESSED